jgi:phenylpropionate dioxygenase-like ring-hydroxylating dioxygenase large terminal subunit
VLREELQECLAPVSEARTLPAYCYTSDGFYAFEQEAILARDWFCVGRESAIPNPGDYFTLEVADEPLIVVRTHLGSISVLSNVCRHRAALMLNASGHCRALRCPYHGWSYDLNGHLINAPLMTRTAAFKKQDVTLPALAVECWGGFIFASFQAPTTSLAARWSRLDDLICNYGLADLRGPVAEGFDFDWNWKTMLENAGECYHCTLVHGELHGTAPTRNTVPPPLDYAAGAFVTRVRNTGIDTDFNATGKVLLPPIPTLSLEDRSHSTWAILPPNLFLSLQHDNVHYFLVLPKGPNRTRMEVGYLYPESTLGRADFADQYAKSLKAWMPIMDQDADMNRRVAAGLRSRSVTRGRFSWQEYALAAFAQWLAEKYLTLAIELSEGAG